MAGMGPGGALNVPERPADLEAARLVAWAQGDPEREDALVEAAAAILRAGGSEVAARNLRGIAYRALNGHRGTLTTAANRRTYAPHSRPASP